MISGVTVLMLAQAAASAPGYGPPVPPKAASAPVAAKAAAAGVPDPRTQGRPARHHRLRPAAAGIPHRPRCAARAQILPRAPQAQAARAVRRHQLPQRRPDELRPGGRDQPHRSRPDRRGDGQTARRGQGNREHVRNRAEPERISALPAGQARARGARGAESRGGEGQGCGRGPAAGAGTHEGVTAADQRAR